MPVLTTSHICYIQQFHLIPTESGPPANGLKQDLYGG